MKWSCGECGVTYDEKMPMCSACWSQCIWPVPLQNDRVLWTSAGRRGIRRAGELRRPAGEYTRWKDLGKLPEHWKMLVYGAPGAGKSTFASLLADDFRTGLYVAHEEGDESIADRVQRLEIANMYLSDAAKYTEILADLEDLGGEVDILALDSITSMGLSVEKFSMLSGQASRIVAVAQITKDGNFAGTQAYAHLADVVLEVSGMQVRVEKNRYGPACSFPVLDLSIS